MSKQIKLGLVVQLGFGTIFFLMLVIGVVSKFTMGRLRLATDWVENTYRIEEKLKDLEKTLVDAETGQRGFIFTEKNNFLEPYNQAKSKIEFQFEQLNLVMAANPDQLKRLRSVEKLSDQKINELAETIRLKKAGKEAEVRTLVLSGKGKRLMDQIRLKIAEMVQVEDRLLAQRKATAQQAELVAQSVSIGGTFIAILIGSFIVIFIIRKVVHPINQVAGAIASSSTEIASTVEEHERIASHQATSVNQTTTTMDELGASSRQAAQQAETVAAGGQQALNLAAIGNEAVEDTLEGMSELKAKVGAIAEKISRLSEQTYQIGSISNLVSELANQTNMLALNAAVEAVRAGEHGKGFGVVAAEIRKLADQSKKSAEKINSLVNDIQTAINATVIVTDEGTQTVEKGAKIALGTAQAFNGISEAIHNFVLNSQQISLNAKQQVIAIQQIVDAMNSLNEAAAQTASGISQTKISAQQLKQAAINLKSVV